MNKGQMWGQRGFTMMIIGFLQLVLFAIVWLFSGLAGPWLTIIAEVGMILSVLAFFAGLIIVCVLAIPKRKKKIKPEEKVTPKQE